MRLQNGRKARTGDVERCRLRPAGLRISVGGGTGVCAGLARRDGQCAGAQGLCLCPDPERRPGGAGGRGRKTRRDSPQGAFNRYEREQRVPHDGQVALAGRGLPRRGVGAEGFSG